MGQLERLEAIEDFKQLKHRCHRYVDYKQIKKLTELFVVDRTTAYDNNRMSFNGRQAAFDFHDTNLSNKKTLNEHHSHHPEINVINKPEASRIWHNEKLRANV